MAAKNQQPDKDQTFPKTVRLLVQPDFDNVYRSSFVAADQTLVVKGVPNGTVKTRLGLSVGKKVGNAVVRNRWKRLIREAFRTQKQDIPDGLDLVVRPRKGADCDSSRIFKSLALLANKISRRISKSQSESRS